MEVQILSDPVFIIKYSSSVFLVFGLSLTEM